VNESSSVQLRKSLLAHHHLYRLRIIADQAIPGLTPQSESRPEWDLRVHLKRTPAFPPGTSPVPKDFFHISSGCDKDGQPVMRAAMLANGAYYGLFYSDGARFAVRRDGAEVWVDWPDGYVIEDAATYLVGPVMGLVLRLKGIVPLHASAVAIENHAVALVGMPGAGKSTTAAAFARQGYSVLSDDIAALDDTSDGFLVAPGYPRVNLWPDSARALFGSENVLPLVTPTWGKHYLPLEQTGCRFQSKPLPLAAIYVLSDREPERLTPQFEEVTATEALTTLLANTYVNYLLDRAMRRLEFDVLSRLVASVPIRRIRPPEDPSRILTLCEAIADDARNFCLAGALEGN
jgi:hypothetical protein